MQVLSEFLVLLLAGIAAIFYFDPRLKGTWSPRLRYLMIAIVAFVAVGQMLLKGMTGKGLDDRAADIVANVVCRISVVSSRCPSEVQKRVSDVDAFMDKQASFAALIENNRAKAVKPVFKCPVQVRYVNLEQGECKPYPCSLVPDMDNGVEGPQLHSAWFQLGDPPHFVTCTGFKLGDKGTKYRLPNKLNVCSFTNKDFSCW